MCRNIRVLHNFEPPTTADEMRAAALQYVRKVSGVAKVSAANEAAFARALDEIAASTTRLLEALPPRTPHRTRDHEKAKAKMRFLRRAPVA